MQVVDLFCGAGGFSEGARLAGHHVCLAVDADPDAVAVHVRNHQNTDHVCTALPDVDVSARVRILVAEGAHVHASPPCQKLSQANRVVEEDETANALALVRWYLEDIVVAMKPTSWSFEQVCAPVIISILEKLKTTHPNIFDYERLNCADVGIPQERKRLVAGTPEIIQRVRNARVSAPRRCIRDAIPDPPGTHMKTTATNTPDRINGGHRPLRPTEGLRSVTRPSYTILAKGPPSWTNEGGVRIRSLTVEECARLQTFPPDYDLSGTTKGRAQRYVGNAVPPELARIMMTRSDPLPPKEAGWTAKNQTPNRIRLQ